MGQDTSFQPHLAIRVGFLLIAFFLLFSLAQNISRITLAQGRLQKARQELVNVENEKKDLENKLKIADSMEFREKEARDKLGYARENEIIVVLPPPEKLRELVPKREVAEEFLPDPTWVKWFKLFF